MLILEFENVWLEMVYFEDITTLLCGLSKAKP